MSGPAELAMAAGVLVDAGLKATIVLALGWGVTRLMPKRSASQRHAVWAVTIVGLPLLVALAATRGAELAIDAPWLVGVWAVGAAVTSLPLLHGVVGLWRLRANATPDPTIPRLFHSHHVAAPVTWGLLRPVIVFPASAEGWTDADRRAAIVHERAHIARRDWAVHMAVWVVCALFWFHPLVWMARRHLAREAEHAADDAVITQGVRPSDYAQLLVTLAKRTTPHAALGVSSSLVSKRVHAVLAARSRSERRWPAWSLAVALCAIALPALGSVPTWSAPPEALTCAPEPNQGFFP